MSSTYVSEVPDSQSPGWIQNVEARSGSILYTMEHSASTFWQGSGLRAHTVDD